MNRFTENIDGIIVSSERYDKHSPCHYCEYQSTDNCLQEECTYANTLNKLAAYEDTGLEPEELQEFMKRIDLKDLHDHISELLDLEKQGLLIKLPCKVGTIVWCIDDTDEDLPWCIEFDYYMIDQIGKTVFLTREEAEKALDR